MTFLWTTTELNWFIFFSVERVYSWPSVIQVNSVRKRLFSEDVPEEVCSHHQSAGGGSPVDAVEATCSESNSVKVEAHVHKLRPVGPESLKDLKTWKLHKILHEQNKPPTGEHEAASEHSHIIKCWEKITGELEVWLQRKRKKIFRLTKINKGWDFFLQSLEETKIMTGHYLHVLDINWSV